MPLPDADDRSHSDASKKPVRILKGTAVLTVVLGLLIVVWLVDKAVRYPEIKATQFGSVAPLWGPFALFIAVGVVLIARLFWRAAQRVEDGEDLFAQRHRRRPGAPPAEDPPTD